MKDVTAYLDSAKSFMTDEYGVIFSSMLCMLLFGFLLGFIYFRIIKFTTLAAPILTSLLLAVVPLMLLTLWVYDVSGLYGRTITTAFFSLTSMFVGGYLMIPNKDNVIQKTRN